MDISTNKTISFFRALILIFMLGALVGCEGDDGAPGAQGPPGPPGSSLADLSTLSFEQQATLGTVSIQEGSVAVSITSPPVVTFTLIDSFGRPVLGLDSIVAGGENNVIRFTLARLVDANPDYWSSYLINAGVGSYDSPRTGGTLVSNGDGSYIYTWAYDVGADANFNPADTHRLASQIGDSDLGFEPSNFFMDFVPNGNTVTLSRNVATTASCNECHDPLNIHGRRRLVGYCVTCHTSELAEGEGEMSFMIHKLHAAGDFEVLDDAVSYAELTYPQELLNCRKCHNGADAETPQGDNWQTVQNAKICFTSCHAVPDSIPAFHSPTTASCAACHGTAVAAALDIDAIHTTPNATENNPNLLPGQRNIEYQLDSAAISGGNLEIIFRILSDGTAINLESLPADLVAGDRWPAFLFAYALGTQDGIAEPSDFNNLGNSAGQPESADLGDLVDGIGGSMACDDGTCTATMTDPFPVDAMMRTVGLQGYFRQDLDNDGAYDVSLHSQSAVVTVTGDTARRAVADTVGCSACHEFFEGHGGNRVFSADGGIQICTLCHNPNLSSSGRSIDPADAADSSAAEDLGTSDTLTWPEATNNFKDMIHGIHAAAFRTTDYEFVRGRNNGIYYNWAEVTFPGDVSNCNKCHLDSTYLPGGVPADALTTTNRTTGVADGMDATFTDVGIARDNMPNNTDWVITPITAACYACHDNLAAMGHMELNGGAINRNRGDVIMENPIETCDVCHGEGKIADVGVSHDL